MPSRVLPRIATDSAVLRWYGNAGYKRTDDKWLVSGANGIYRSWEVGTWEHRDTPGAFPYLMAFSDDGETMAVTPSATAVRLLDPKSGRTLAELEAPNPQMVSWLCFTPDGSRLAVACSTHLIQLWDLRRIRRQLAAMELDWNSRSLPSADVDAREPIQVEVDQGMLAPSQGGS